MRSYDGKDPQMTIYSHKYAQSGQFSPMCISFVNQLIFKQFLINLAFSIIAVVGQVLCVHIVSVAIALESVVLSFASCEPLSRAYLCRVAIRIF